MVYLRGLQSTSDASATESTTGAMEPSSNSTTVTTKKQTTSSGQVITTVTTSTTTVSINNSASKTEGDADSTTTITTTEGASPVTKVVVDNGVNTTTTLTTKDAATGITTVTSTTKSDSDMNGSASSSTTWTTTSGGSSNTAESSSSTTSSTSQQTSTSTTTTSSSTGATTEGASTSMASGTSVDGNSVRLTTSSGTGTNGETSTTESTSNGVISDSIVTSGSANGNINAAIATGASSTSTTASTTSTSSSSAATSSSSGTKAYTSTTTTTSSLNGSTNGVARTTASSGDSSMTTSSSATETPSTTTPSDGSLSSATTSMSGSGSMATSSSSSSSSSSSLATWFNSNFRDEETQLVVGAMNSSTPSLQVCDGLPALVTRSSTETPNGGCPDELTALNASCTCITGYSETASSWVFHITSESWNSTTSTTTRSLTQSSSDELAINTIRPMWVSSSLETLELEGSGASPAEITFINENRETSSPSLTLVLSASNSTNISTLSISNINLNSIAEENSDFVPATVTTLTLRNCNISTLSSSFTREWSWLQHLDLSSNNISTEYIGGAALKELNLSHNALAVLPTGSLNTSGLEALYIQGNNIKDFNVTEGQFERIQGLTSFTADQADASSTCQGGAWQSAHNTTFCVLGASTAAVPDSSQSSASNSGDDHGGLGLLTYWLIGGAIIIFSLLLLVIWQRRRHNHDRGSSPIVSPESIEPTTPKYNANDAFCDALNRDNAAAVAPAANAGAARTVSTSSAIGSGAGGAAPLGAASAAAVGTAAYPSEYGRSHGSSVDSENSALGASLANNSILTSCRLDYSDVTLGRCISRGGFGLVFVGSYRGRQVAVKKIRNERDVEREQVEQFVREISLISGLSHPRIVEFIGACWTTPAELSAVTELMERGDLRDVTRRFKRRGYRLTWEAHKTIIALHIAEALTYLHGLSPTVIHRDLKAKNVLLNADMEAKLSDFGIARERNFYDGSEHMTVGIGTSFWIAPEVLLGRDYDERADIYSFGVVLSEIDTDDYPYWNAQHPPQGKAQENEILRLVARGAKRPAFSDDCPPAILELAAHCLRADPEERPSASEIVVYLQQLVQDRTSSASFSRHSFDFNTRSTSSSSPTRTAPANTIVNLRSSAGEVIQQNQAMSVTSSAAAYAAGKRTKRTTTTTTTKVAASSVDTASSSYSRPTTVEALAPAHEIVVPSPQVTHQVVRTKIHPKGKRSTTTTTTTTQRTQQGSTSSTTSSNFVIGMVAGSSDGASSGRSLGSESVPSSRSHAGLPFAGATSPTSLRVNHQAAMDNLNQQRQLSSSSGEDEKKYETTAVDTNHQWLKWTVHEDVREL